VDRLPGADLRRCPGTAPRPVRGLSRVGDLAAPRGRPAARWRVPWPPRPFGT